MENNKKMEALRLYAVKLAADIANLKKEFAMELCFDKDLQDELRQMQAALRDCAAVALAVKEGKVQDKMEYLNKEQIKERGIAIRKADIIKAITENQSAEISGDTATYYLHVTEDGEILGSMYGADCTLVADRDISAYVDDESPDRVYDTETMSDKTFSDMIDILCDAVSGMLDVAE